jgi:hypothetical protein
MHDMGHTTKTDIHIKAINLPAWRSRRRRVSVIWMSDRYNLVIKLRLTQQEVLEEAHICKRDVLAHALKISKMCI